MPTLGDVVPRNVAAERARKRWTQRELAERLGWARSTLSEFESGQRAVFANDLGLLCEVLGVNLLKLAEGADEIQALGL